MIKDKDRSNDFHGHINNAFTLSQVMNQENCHPLIQAVSREILARLEVVALRPKRIVAKSCHGLEVYYPYADILSSTKQEKSVDLIIWNGSLEPWLRVESMLGDWRKILKPQGLLMFACLGPRTFAELAFADPKPPFMDMHNLGDALLQEGFSDPVMDIENFEICYKNTTHVLDDLANMEITEVKDNGLSLTYEIIYGHAWCPDYTDDFLPNSDGLVNIPLAALRRKLLG